MAAAGRIGKICVKFSKLNNNSPECRKFAQSRPDKTTDRSSA
ncbi:hypothetical protein X965_15935 [Morganella sp. EGD-HP17]|nr:hypothetical protein X965_15935 [Morganella sp. EGD-HP17]